MTDMTDHVAGAERAPERIWIDKGGIVHWVIPSVGALTEYVRADLSRAPADCAATIEECALICERLAAAEEERFYKAWPSHRGEAAKKVCRQDYEECAGAIRSLASHAPALAEEWNAAIEAAAKEADRAVSFWTESKARLRPLEEAPDAHDRFFNYIENAKALARSIRALSSTPAAKDKNT